MRLLGWTLWVAFMLSAPVAHAQQAPPSDDDPIVVTGQTLREQVETFVQEMTSKPPGSGQLPRWHRTICPLIAGSVIARDHAQAAVDRLAVRAREVGLQTEAPGCRANILVFVTHRVAEMTSRIADDYRTFVRYAPGGIRPPSHPEFRAFDGGERAVNWMYIAAYMSPDGRFYTDGAHQSIGVPPTRLQPHARQDFAQVIIVMDAARIQGVSAHALGDYLALISLARIDARADMSGGDTILNLFMETADRPDQMSGWDEAYLRGTYRADRDARSSRVQERDIAAHMERQLTAEAATAQ